MQYIGHYVCSGIELRCNDKRFSTNHSLTDSNSLLRTSSISDTSLLEASSAESSAYSSRLAYVTKWRSTVATPVEGVSPIKSD